MKFKWLDQFEARVQRLCSIEREDARDRGRSTGKGGKASAGGTAGGATSGGLSKEVTSLQEARKEQRDLNKARATQSGTAGKQTEGGGTQPNKPAYVTPMDQPAPPGATPYDEGATPYGVASTVLGGIGNAVRRGLTQGFTGTDPDADEMGTQTGWSADRTKGGTFNSNDPRGADAGQLDDEREIAGRPFRADGTDETDDPVSETPGSSASGDIYSDVMLKDRRKPVPTLKQMLESML
jgi:hypothetical protein